MQHIDSFVKNMLQFFLLLFIVIDVLRCRFGDKVNNSACGRHKNLVKFLWRYELANIQDAARFLIADNFLKIISVWIKPIM